MIDKLLKENKYRTQIIIVAGFAAVIVIMLAATTLLSTVLQDRVITDGAALDKETTELHTEFRLTYELNGELHVITDTFIEVLTTSLHGHLPDGNPSFGSSIMYHLASDPENESPMLPLWSNFPGENATDLDWRNRKDVSYWMDRLTNSGLFPAMPALDMTGFPELVDEDDQGEFLVNPTLDDAYRLAGVRLISVEVLSQRLIHISGSKGLYDELTAQMAGSFDGRLLLARAITSHVTLTGGGKPDSFHIVAADGTTMDFEIVADEEEGVEEENSILDKAALDELIQAVNNFNQAGRTMSHYEKWIDRHALEAISAEDAELRLIKLYFEPLESNWISPAHIIIDLRDGSIHSFEDGEFHPDTWNP